MILLFLGSWRSTLIVVISIPLSILVSIIDARMSLGQTLNVMTLGGMALAVGILVDDATVEIENIHRNIGQRKPIVQRDPRRRAGDRRAGVRLDAVHLHRVRAGRVHHRRREVAVRAARDGRRVRDDDVVLAVANARADDGALPPRAARRWQHHKPERVSRGGSIAGFDRGFARPTAATARLARSQHRAFVSIAFVVFVARLARALPARRPRLLPDRRRRADQAARPRPARHAHRGDRAAVRRDRRARSAASIPAARDRHDARQHRHAVQRHQPVAQRGRADLAGRRRRS